MMKADLHVHSLHSGSRYYRKAGLRDSYASPEQVYDAAKAAGMDLVTITDLDTIDGCLELREARSDPVDFIFGEEVEAGLPDSGLRVHLNVWGVDERQHAEISRLKGDVTEVASFLKEEGIASCFNHFVGTLPANLPSARTYRSIISLFDALEVRNGAQGSHYNALIASLAVGEASRRPGIAFIGGSDAHTLRRVGTTWTEAEASTREEFLGAIRDGRTAAGGRTRRNRDIPLDIGALTLSHYASMLRPQNGTGPAGNGAAGDAGRNWGRAVAMVPVQILGAPLVGTMVYFYRVRAQVKALEREIAALDLQEFRQKMRDYPRP